MGTFIICSWESGKTETPGEAWALSPEPRYLLKVFCQSLASMYGRVSRIILHEHPGTIPPNYSEASTSSFRHLSFHNRRGVTQDFSHGGRGRFERMESDA